MTYHTDSVLKQPPPEPQPPNELWEIAQYNATVHLFLDSWMHGDFPSYEGMLTSLVQRLAERIHELEKDK